jgi:hypothetical protein
MMNCTIKWILPAATTGILLAMLGFSAPGSPEDRLDPDPIARGSGTKATTTPDGVVRIAWARTDVPVKVDGVPLKPFAGLDPL